MASEPTTAALGAAPARTEPLAVPPPPPGPYDAFRRRRFFTNLDGLRALSILAVIWHHAASPVFPAWVPLVHEGKRGVNLFFVISAFLISTLLLRAKERGTLNVPRFWGRRALRILPLYYAMLGAYIGLVWLFEHDATARAGFFAHLRYFATFTSNWFVALDSPRVIFYFAWSLAAEEQFYLCWPWVERVLSRFWPAVVAVVGLVVTQAAGWEYERGGAVDFGLKLVSSVPAAILLGVVLAHVLHTPRGFRWVAALAGRRGSGVAAFLVLLGALAVEPQLGFFGELVVAVSMTLVVATCVVREDGDLSPFLRLRGVAWIGTISYGIYLMHVLCIGVVRGGLQRLFGAADPYLLFVLSSLLAIAVASLSYVTYERFFLRLKDRWFGESPRRAAPRPAIESIPS